MMEKQEIEKLRLEQIPILHVRGTHFNVGFAIGRQFRASIEDVLEKSVFYNQFVLPAYETEEGKLAYNTSLNLCKRKFPGYLQEIEGISQGSRIPFFKIFLLNLEFFITSPDKVFKNQGESGCSSIISNFENNLSIGHTEDAGPELLNNVFIVSAEIINENGEKMEKFSTLTYAGCLPGYTMGYNEFGFVHSINTLYPLKTFYDKTPRAFLARHMLHASNVEQLLEILRDKGNGVSNGFSINAHFANQEGPKVMYNIEVSPNPDADESIVNVLTINTDESYAHCNKFLRLQIPELPRAFVSSVHRHEAIKKHPIPQKIEVVKDILSDRSDPEYAIFRYGEKEPDLIATVAVGIFDLKARKWNIFTNPPNSSKPVVVINMEY